VDAKNITQICSLAQTKKSGFSQFLPLSLLPNVFSPGSALFTLLPFTLQSSPVAANTALSMACIGLNLPEWIT
jgi:hypothetical protein